MSPRAARLRTHRHRRTTPAHVHFQLAHAPLRRTWQGRQRSTWEPRLPQLDHLHPDDLPPVSVQRGTYYAPAAAPDLPLRYQIPLARLLGLAIVAVMLWGSR